MAKCAQCGRNLPGFSFGRKLCPWCVQHEAAKRGEDTEYQRVMPTPWTARRDGMTVTFTQIFAGICAAVFLGMTLSGISVMSPTGQQLVDWGANFAPYTFGGEWWRLITYMFLHVGIIHIAFNMWCLWDLGALAESLYGHWTFAAIYLVSGLAGGLVSGWWHIVPSAGASGAIFGIAGALIASFKLGEFTLPRGALQGPLRSMVAFVVYNVAFGFFFGADNACHIGGLLAGLTMGALIAIVAPQHDAFGRRLAIVLGVLGMVVGGVVYMQHSRGYNVYAQRGAELLQSGKADDAIAQMQKAVRLQPKSADMHFYLAQAYMTKSQFGQAESELQRVLELDPKSLDALNALGYCYFSGKKFPQARETYTRMATLDSDSAAARLGLGMVDGAEGKHQDAIREYTAAAALNPRLNGLYYNLGHSYAALKDYDRAIAAYQQEQELSGDDAAIESGLAEAYRAKGMSKEADEAAKKAQPGK